MPCRSGRSPATRGGGRNNRGAVEIALSDSSEDSSSILLISSSPSRRRHRVITEISPIFKIIARISPTSCSDKPLHKITQINPLFEEITHIKSTDILYSIRVCVYITTEYITIKY